MFQKLKEKIRKWLLEILQPDIDALKNEINESNTTLRFATNNCNEAARQCQILGYLKWETNDDLEKLLPKFDEELIIYAYEKIWSELSELDRKIVYVISTGVYKTGEIREKLSISPQLLNTYRKRLMERGVVNGSVRGELTLALPRFEEYIEMYCEVNL